MTPIPKQAKEEIKQLIAESYLESKDIAKMLLAVFNKIDSLPEQNIPMMDKIKKSADLLGSMTDTDNPFINAMHRALYITGAKSVIDNLEGKI